ncbi:MAG TPA: hypothetical protein VD772_07105 [Anseongella sp.]|nr:hypothetical protein [Anseongella sp.]
MNLKHTMCWTLAGVAGAADKDAEVSGDPEDSDEEGLIWHPMMPNAKINMPVVIELNDFI